MIDDVKKQRILTSVSTIPSKSLVNYITTGAVTKSEVVDKLKAINKESKVAELESLIFAYDKSEWDKAQATNTAEAYATYLSAYPDGIYATNCRQMLAQMESMTWADVESAMTEDSLRQYKRLFPGGVHLDECNALLSDLPWLEAKKTNMISSYERYMQAYPGRHDEEARAAINDLNDDWDWDNAKRTNSTDSYNAYLEMHPSGQHIYEALTALNASEGRDKILDELSDNRNAYTPLELQSFVGNHVISWENLKDRGIYDDEEIDAIKRYVDATPLPDGIAPESIGKDTTEVYFWGTPSSGKTCALGAILSAAKKYGILSKEACSGRNYMDLLCNIFDSRYMCTFPQGTPDYSIQEMRINLRDNKNKDHSLTLIDLAGEVFRAMYRKQLGIPEDSYTREKALEVTLSYLSNDSNRKIHFFIIAYGEEDKKWDGLYMTDYLESTMEYLKAQNAIKRNTNAVYVLVTKSDMMPCRPEERQQFATDYVRTKMTSFYNNIRLICSNAGVNDFEVLPFSVGDVFAQKLCKFDSDYTDIILNKLILKSQKKKTGLFGWLES